MRRILVLLICLVLLLCLCVSVSAENQINTIVSNVTVSSDGSCQVNSTITVHLDQPMSELVYPIPLEATTVSLNGSRVLTQTTDTARTIDLSRTVGKLAGDVTIAVSYRISGLVRRDEDGLLQLELPLLSGFAYPVQAYELTVVLPGPSAAKPGFSSGYHQADIEKNLSFTVDGATIVCRSQKPMKDHETLKMNLIVNEEMFPQTVILAPDLVNTNIAAGVCAGLAFLYWLIFLRCLVPFGQRRTTPPEGFSAGQMSSVLHLQGADLSLMVLSWAQLGYLLIHHDRHGRVRLYKQMEMGNERSSFERRCFNGLFVRRPMVDTASSHYAAQYSKVMALPPNVQSFVKKGSGNVRIFRFLCSLVGLFCGVGIGVVLGAEAAAQWLVVVLSAAFGLLSTRYILLWACSLWSRDKSRIYISLALCVLWVVLGLIAQQMALALWAIAAALGFGLLAAFGGRRTPEGRQAIAQVFGIRRYLTGVSVQDVRRICQSNPEYFHSLAPYALALNADKQFARRFGSERTACPWLREDRELLLTASGWSEHLRLVLDTMNFRVRQQGAERIRKFIQNLLPPPVK